MLNKIKQKMLDKLPEEYKKYIVKEAIGEIDDEEVHEIFNPDKHEEMSAEMKYGYLLAKCDYRHYKKNKADDNFLSD